MMGKRTRNVMVGVVLACAVILTWADMASAEQTTWGYAREWLFLGPYVNKSVTRPSTVANMQQDFLTNGLTVTEDNFTPRPGATVNTDYNVAGSASYRDRQNGAPTPTVKYYMTGGITVENVDLNVVYPSPNGTNPGNQNEDSMNYSWVYANNKTGAPLACYVGMSSDDGCQVKVNNVEIGSISVGRGITGAGAISNAWPCTLTPGANNKIVIKVFNGGTGYGVKMRLQTGTVLTPATAAEYIPPSRAELGFFDRTGVVSRTIAAPGTFSASLPLNITLTAVPVQGGAVTVRETMPTGWTPTFTPPALPQTAAFAAGVLTWTIPNLTTTSTLAYTLPPPAGDCTAVITFTGTFDAGTGWTGLTIGGTATATRVADQWQDAILPWTNAEWISGPTSAEPLIGSVAYYSCNDSYLLTGSGHDIWDTADDFEFIYATVTGVFQMQATVELTPGGTPPNTWAKAGIMARANNTDGAPYVIMAVTGTGPGLTGDRQVCYQWRDAQGGGAADAGAPGRAANNATAIIRLERTAASGTSIIGGYDNGEGVVNWAFGTHAAPNIPTGAPIIVGLALTSHITGTNTTGRFTNVTRTGAFPPPSTPPAAPSNLTAAIVNNRVQLGWTDNSTNETGFKIERKVGAAGTYAEITIAASNTTSYIDMTTAYNTTYMYRVRSTNAAGDSAYSNEATVTTPATAPLGVRNWRLYEK